jgi:hypothetical protein
MFKNVSRDKRFGLIEIYQNIQRQISLSEERSINKRRLRTLNLK